MQIHKAWSLAAGKAIELISQRYQRSLTNVHFGQPTPSEKENLGVENDELFITEPYVTELDSPPPIGQLVEAQYQLQQPALFGAFIYLFSPHIYSPWRSDLTELSGTSRQVQEAALELDQLRAELVEQQTRPFGKVVFNSFLAVHLFEKLDPHASFIGDELTEHLVKTLLLDVFSRLKIGTARTERQRRTLRDMRHDLAGLFNENMVVAIEGIIEELTTTSGDDADEMLALGRKWNTLADNLDYSSVDEAEIYDLLRSYVTQIRDTAAEDVETLQIAHPPAITPLAAKTPPRTMQEWTRELSNNDEESEEDSEESVDNPNVDEDSETDLDQPNDGEEVTSAGIGIPANRWITYRKPTEDEQRQAIAMARTLKQLRYRRPYMARHGVQTPGGRLDTRQLVQMTAQRTRGTAITATPWQRQMAIPNEQPGLTAALVLDTSASMAVSRQAILSLNWVLSQAARTVGGTVATWGFGGDAFELIRAGTQPAQVPVAVDSGAGSAGAALALARAADAAKLESCGGVRVAVVITDGALDEPGSTKESSDLEAVLANLQKAGVFTLLLQVGGGKVGAVESAKIVDCGLLAEDMVATLEEEILTAYKADLYL